jgi:transcriptional regulator with XRE-family HTH domain
MNTIGERIKDVRSSKQMSQQMLADSVGVKRATVSQWEIGDTKNLRPTNLLAVADALHLSMRWLITGRGEKNDTSLHAAEEPAQYNRLSVEAIELCHQWEKLPKEAREQARQFVYMLIIMASLEPHVTLKNIPKNLGEFEKILSRSILQKKQDRAA